MSQGDTVLLVDPLGGAGSGLRAVLEAGGIPCQVATSAAQAMLQLASWSARLVVVDSASLSEIEAIGVAADRHAVGLLCSGEAPDASAWQAWMEVGCRGFISLVDQAPEEVLAKVRRAVDSCRVAAVRRDEQHRLKFQYEELKRYCQQQAESFEQSREVFTLDLSRMMTIISNIMDGIVFADRAGSISLLNPVAEDLLGVKAFLATKKQIRDLEGNGELIIALAADHERVLEHGEYCRTIEVHHSEQDLLYIKIHTSQVMDYRGECAEVLSVLQDVTAEYKSDQLRNQYLSIVAHELRTPLTGIKTFSTMMCKGTLGDLSERQERVMESIREQSLRLEHQIDKLINLGHIESEDYGQDPEIFELDEILATLLAPFEQSAKDHSIELAIEREVRPDLRLRGDRTDLRRACQALVENAVKFTGDGGSVVVRVHEEDDKIRFSVKDTGVGIDPRYHRRIFEKFFQVEDPLTRHHGGAGLGLFVAQGIVEAHEGRIGVTSELGKGAEFFFALPLFPRQGQPVHAAAGERASSSIHQA